MEVALAMHDECLRSLLHKHCGYEVSCWLAHHASQPCLSNSLCCPPPNAAAAIRCELAAAVLWHTLSFLFIHLCGSVQAKDQQ